MKDAGRDLVLRGADVREDSVTGAVCLNDLWKIAGSPDNQRARDWYRSKRVLALERTLQERIVEISHKSPKEVEGSTYYARGRGQGALTFAHPVLALDYVQYVDPKLAIEVNELFLKYRADAVSLALEILEGMEEQADYDAVRVQLRELVKAHNKMAVGVAKEVGVRNFGAYNGAGLRGQYGGMNKAQLLRHKGLEANAHHLDHASHEELAANYFKATQAMAKIKREGIQGQAPASNAHHEVGEAVRLTIKGLGGCMPEDEPALEHIRQAEKRLKTLPPPPPKVLPKRPPKLK